jgi:hypothetical protein
MNVEVWKDVINFEGRYWISSHGRLKSHDHRKNTIKIIACYVDCLGYLNTELNWKPQIRKVRVHTLVAEHFIKKPKDNYWVNHIDGNKLNNNVTNLEWVEPSYNCFHARQIGLNNHKGSNHTHSKITEAQVKEIRSLAKEKTHKEIANKYGLNRRNVGDIINRVTWKHVA